MAEESKEEAAQKLFERLEREDEQRIRKEGWLTKQGGGTWRSNWSLRWCQLTLSSLSYYVDKQKSECRGCIDIKLYDHWSVSESSERPHCIALAVPGRTYLLCAENDRERREWISAINDCFYIKTEQRLRHAKVEQAQAEQKMAQLTLLTHDERAIAIEGWLNKKGGTKGGRRNWRRRYFTLSLVPGLCYYPSEKKRPTDLIKCIPIEEILEASASSKKLHTISLVLPGRQFLMEAASEPERQNWLEAFNNCRLLKSQQTKRATEAKTLSTLGLRMKQKEEKKRNDDQRHKDFVKAEEERAARIAKAKERTQLPIDQWTVEDVCLWLDLINAPSAVPAFRENQVTGPDLLELHVSELENELGVENAKARLNIFRALEELKKEQLPPVVCQEASTAPKAPENPRDWTTVQVAAWLVAQGCEDAVEAFSTNCMTGADLFELSETEVRSELGLSDETLLTQLAKAMTVLRLRFTAYVPE
eukprot:CAMPEP_0177651612 /NCGR_PEP_ID=MMETSP0447-20121125/12654_1 /TAXON_ID=0 /ORGANISM="Stygamoeba regulata, Strain BSH-02190019" /LENGTH=475 /DNA_ID=CAMNT_0019154731 /DNA_START=62 /DNA_END=1489 /DNA_ORIENTATION=-